MRAAGAHEWNRRSGYGKKPEIDAGVNRKMCEKKNGNTHDEERIEVRGGAARQQEKIREEETIQAEEQHDANEAPLFGECGEYEIGLIFGKESKLGLRAVPNSLSP